VKNVTPGTVVDPSKDVFVIGDLRHLWMLASVNDANISKMRVGLRASVTAKAFPAESFAGRVTNLAPQLDPLTRAMAVRIELDNRALKLRPEMLATAQIEAGVARPVILIPFDSVQQIGDQDVVFVRISEDHFSVRAVHTGPSMNGRVSVLEGLKPGDVIVVRGSFVLKSQLLKASIEEGD
jgi:cobalt-zinc-cadmium efflux system membrane fusion protein